MIIVERAPLEPHQEYLPERVVVGLHSQLPYAAVTLEVESIYGNQSVSNLTLGHSGCGWLSFWL